MSFLNHKIPLSQYINHYLISPSILAQACPFNTTVLKGAKEEGAVVPEHTTLHYLEKPLKWFGKVLKKYFIKVWKFLNT